MDNNSTSVPELNIKVVILGLVLSVVMGSANVYLGLKAGMTVSASIPAAVVGMLALRAARGIDGKSLGGSILKQTKFKQLPQLESHLQQESFSRCLP